MHKNLLYVASEQALWWGILQKEILASEGRPRSTHFTLQMFFPPKSQLKHGLNALEQLRNIAYTTYDLTSTDVT